MQRALESDALLTALAQLSRARDSTLMPARRSAPLVCLVNALVLLFMASSLVLADPQLDHRVLPAGTLPDDERLGPLKNLNGYFPFTPPATRDDWRERSRAIAAADAGGAGIVAHARPKRPPTPWSTDWSIATTTRSSTSTSKAFRDILSPAISIGRRASRAGCRACSVRTDIGPMAASPINRRSSSNDRERGRALRGWRHRRCKPLRAVGPHGRVVFHYDMVGYADSVQISRACPPVRQAAARHEHAGELGLVQARKPNCGCRA